MLFEIIPLACVCFIKQEELYKVHDANYSRNSEIIQLETALANEFVVSKTSSRSMLAHSNQIKANLHANCMGFDSFANISQDLLEEIVMNYPYSINGISNSFRTAIEYWKDKKAIM